MILAGVLLVGSQFLLWSRLSSGSPFAPEMPCGVVLAFNVAYGAILLLAVFQLAVDLARLPALLIGQGGFVVAVAVRYAMGLAALVLAALGVAQAQRVPPVRNIDVVIPGLPAAFDGYTLVQLTDLHISRLFPARWTQAVVDRTNALHPDLIVVTGDFIDGSIAMRRADVEPLRGLRAADGIYAIPGNHEYFFEYEAWMAHFAGMGMHLLPNAHAVLTRGDGRLVIAGVTDLSARETGHPTPDLGKALAGAPAGAPIILLDHQPRMARTAAARGVALQLSGHTHGGMIVGLDRLVARGNAGFVSGRYAVEGMTLYVSNGTGLWPGFALRLGVPSELTRITLRAGPR
ncbi:metallophosphoesterase [Sphingomonas sp. PAMC 26621]|uniref:metallophosphoesterase n=1 Tax=Sphingomonas sp. PAMC 26621 TaxID=1112213 RepID=UPI000289066F|nr:metallophosphoesterase [Sphingomonas sp. PAMC 26621]